MNFCIVVCVFFLWLLLYLKIRFKNKSKYQVWSFFWFVHLSISLVFYHCIFSCVFFLFVFNKWIHILYMSNIMSKKREELSKLFTTHLWFFHLPFNILRQWFVSKNTLIDVFSSNKNGFLSIERKKEGGTILKFWVIGLNEFTPF